MKLDAFTRRHLESWLSSAYPAGKQRDTARRRMTALFADDPDHWGQAGWPAVDRASQEEA